MSTKPKTDKRVHLPAELRLQILDSSDYKTVILLIENSVLFAIVCRENKDYIFFKLAIRQIPAAAMNNAEACYDLYKQSYVDHNLPPLLPARASTTGLKILPQPPASKLAAMVKFQDEVIDWFVNDFVNKTLSEFQERFTTINVDFPDYSLSTAEYARISRAFYNWEAYSLISRGSKNTSSCLAFLNSLREFELEELSCVQFYCCIKMIVLSNKMKPREGKVRLKDKENIPQPTYGRYTFNQGLFNFKKMILAETKEKIQQFIGNLPRPCNFDNDGVEYGILAWGHTHNIAKDVQRGWYATYYTLLHLQGFSFPTLLCGCGRNCRHRANDDPETATMAWVMALRNGTKCMDPLGLGRPVIAVPKVPLNNHDLNSYPHDRGGGRNINDMKSQPHIWAYVMWDEARWRSLRLYLYPDST